MNDMLDELSQDFVGFLQAAGCDVDVDTEEKTHITFSTNEHKGIIYVYSPASIDVSVDSDVKHFDGFPIARNFINFKISV